MDIELIVLAVIIPLILLAFNIVVLARYIDPEAAAGHYIAKVFLLLGLLLAECTILMLPLDVGNNAGVLGCGSWNNNCGGLDIIAAWQVIYCIIAVLVVIVFPFFIFYYEADDEGMTADEEAGGSFMAKLCNFKNVKKSLASASIYTVVTFGMCALIVGLSYKFAGWTNIPYRLTSVSVASVSFAPIGAPILPIGTTSCNGLASCLLACGTGKCNIQSTTVQMNVTFLVYLACLMSFVGWFIFSVYVGIGFVALPMDCIYVLSTGEARAQKKVLKTVSACMRPAPPSLLPQTGTFTLYQRAEDLLKIANEMAAGQIDFSDDVHSRSERRKRGKIQRGELNRFRLLVDMLESDLEKFQLSDPAEYRKHYNPLIPYAKLAAGIISIIISTAWILHILLYMVTVVPLNNFLNTYLAWFDQWFPAFGTMTVAIFGLYLLLAASKGNFKFGTRFFLIKVHPMEPGKTLMNSFMFNVALILLCVLPATQFETEAFSTYARLSDADVIFGQQMKYMQGMSVFYAYNVFIFMILIFTVLAGIYFAIYPSDREELNKVMQKIRMDRLKDRKGLERKIAQQGGALSAVEMGRAKNWK